ncbi:MAG: pyridoxal phosphate-dependent aminotransferase family protein [Candidatus Marinimicrobia bacterium]|nr:pyridoxal phosphate-dependent aminotransferase family protein [Candidatus Neomarinimicrobiota bacterium]
MPTPILQPVDLVHIIWNDKKYLFFGGYDYHRLSQDPKIKQSVKRSADKYGLNCGGSRVTTGNHPLHIQLENTISGFLKTETTALLPTGYMANLALFEVFATKDIVCYYHPQCHPSLKTAMKMSGLEKYIIPEDMKELDEHIQNHGKKPCIITDGLYSYIPPIQEYAEIVEKYEGALVVDEAHAIGILGDHGRGAVEYFNISKKHLLITGSLSKAIGVSGGFVSGLTGCVRAIRDTIAYATTSAMPLPMVAAAITSLELLQENTKLITDLQQRSLKAKQYLFDLGYDVSVIPSPTISINIDDPKKVDKLREMLIDVDIYPSLIRYPEKPDYFRFALSSAHSDEDIEKLLGVLFQLTQFS